MKKTLKYLILNRNIGSKEELKLHEEFEKDSIIILDDLNEKKIINDKIQAMFERGRRNNLSIFLTSQITMSYQRE